MSSFKIFLDRLVTEGKIQGRLFKSIVDWTVWLYILVPTLVIGGGIYLSWWHEVPKWSEDIPEVVYLWGAMLLSWKGNVRSFLVEADRVFLLRNPYLVVGLKLWGYTYTLLVSASVIAAFLLLIMPFVSINFDMSILKMINFFIYFFGLKIVSILLRSLLIDKLTERWQYGLFNGLLLLFITIFTGILVFFIRVDFLFGMMGIVFVLLSFLLSRPRIYKLSITDNELRIEKQEQQKWVNFIYNLVPELEKTKVISKKKPWFFRRRMFKKRTAVNGFVELFLKIMFRNSDYMLNYLQILFVTVAAMIVVPPFWFKLILFFIFIFFLRGWLTIMWWKITLSQPQFNKYKEYEGYTIAKIRSIKLFQIPAVILVLVVLLFTLIY